MSLQLLDSNINGLQLQTKDKTTSSIASSGDESYFSYLGSMLGDKSITSDTNITTTDSVTTITTDGITNTEGDAAVDQQTYPINGEQSLQMVYKEGFALYFSEHGLNSD